MARSKPLDCPICGSHAHIGELTVVRTNKVFRAVLCDGKQCRLSIMPTAALCFDSEEAAIEAWNERRLIG